MDYLKLFENHSEYETFVSGGTMVKPNVSHCVQENEVHYNPLVDPYNGHAYVDLGLPSGTLWATMNVGANNETDYGLYFAWGETQGYTASQVGNGEGQKTFSWSDYKFNPSGDGSTFTKYTASDGKKVLELEDDAANVNWGGDWHMPTETQYNELLNTKYTTKEWITDYQGSGVNGYLFTSISNGNTLFIPAAGRGGFNGTGTVSGVGDVCDVWSSTRASINSSAYNSLLFSGTAMVIGYNRPFGLSVRGVVG